MIYCDKPGCHAANRDESRFCTRCGAELNTAAAANRTAPSSRNIEQAPPQSAHSKTRQHPPIVALVVIVAILLGALIFAASTCNSTQSPSSSSAAASTSNASGAEPQANAPKTVHAQASVNQYTWSELSEIANMIADAPDDSSAMQIAYNYNLCDKNGNLDVTQRKTVRLSDGVEYEVQPIGLRHDSKTTGGKAGITFMFTQCVNKQPMTKDGSSHGGWKKSNLRKWLSSNFFDSLPSELQDVIVIVDKETNNTGGTTDPTSVTATHDKIWLPSVKELCGDVDWASAKNPPVSIILNKEGEAYERYRHAQIAKNADNEILVMNDSDSDPCDWWLRSTRSRQEGYFYFIDQTGEPRVVTGEANQKKGVVPGFCL